MYHFIENPVTEQEMKQNTQVAVALHNCLLESRRAMVYLQDSRHLTEEIIEKYCLGYLPTDNKDFLQCYKDNKVTSLGFALSGRIIIPIQDSYGYVVALAGREFTGNRDTVKYINTHFPKKEYLYGLPQAKKTVIQQNLCYIVEGYFDVMALAQKGVQNAVAIMGAFFGDERSCLLTRYCNSAAIIPDKDETGENALDRVREQLEKAPFNFTTKVIRFPGDYKDIDDYAKNASKDFFVNLVADRGAMATGLPTIKIFNDEELNILRDKLYRAIPAATRMRGLHKR